MGIYFGGTYVRSRWRISSNSPASLSRGVFASSQMASSMHCLPGIPFLQCYFFKQNNLLIFKRNFTGQELVLPSGILTAAPVGTCLCPARLALLCCLATRRIFGHPERPPGCGFASTQRAWRTGTSTEKVHKKFTLVFSSLKLAKININ